MSGRKRIVWLHFDKIDNFFAICKYCKQTLSYKSSTGNLTSHFKKAHAAIYLAQKSENTENSQSLPNNEDNLPSQTNQTRAVASTSSSTAPASASTASCDSEHLRKRQRTMQHYSRKRPTSPQSSDSSRPGSSQSYNVGDSEKDGTQSNISCLELQEIKPINKKSLSSEDLLVASGNTPEQVEASLWGNSERYKRAQSHAKLHVTQPQEVTFVTADDRLTTLRQEDECDIIGKNVAAKLRSLLPMQKIFAEKIINDTLYEAQLNNLSRASSLNNPPQ